VGPEVAIELQYSLFDAEGELVESSADPEPLCFVFGTGQLPVAIEQAIEGSSVGAVRRVPLTPDQAFGKRDEAAVIVVAREELPEEARPGDELEAESDSGEVVFLRVLELDDDNVWLDTNHPLAGQSVTLELRVISARPAARTELEAIWRNSEANASRPDVPIAALLRAPHRRS
jgi:FKBP-type peptidyl-prolyl cis-trans isomerase SlyD